MGNKKAVKRMILKLIRDSKRTLYPRKIIEKLELNESTAYHYINEMLESGKLRSKDAPGNAKFVYITERGEKWLEENRVVS